MEDNLVESFRNTCLRYWVLRIPGDWTPWEQHKKYADESRYVDDVCEFGFIVEAVNLGYDTLIGLGDGPTKAESHRIEYYLLSRLEIQRLRDDEKFLEYYE